MFVLGKTVKKPYSFYVYSITIENARVKRKHITNTLAIILKYNINLFPNFLYLIII